jgi:diguanylate cyclase (GGDEF)-like protein
MRISGYVDEATGIANARYFNEILDIEWRRALVTKQTIAILLVGIDNFEPLDRAFGRRPVDKCLKRVATALTKAVPRPNDKIARYAGDEFAIMLPDTKNANTVAERCRVAIEALGIGHPERLTGVLTVSIGASMAVPTVGLYPHAIVKAAYQALYRAKQFGGNKVMENQCRQTKTPRISPDQG